MADKRNFKCLGKDTKCLVHLEFLPIIFSSSSDPYLAILLAASYVMSKLVGHNVWIHAIYNPLGNSQTWPLGILNHLDHLV